MLPIPLEAKLQVEHTYQHILNSILVQLLYQSYLCVLYENTGSFFR